MLRIKFSPKSEKEIWLIDSILSHENTLSNFLKLPDISSLNNGKTI